MKVYDVLDHADSNLNVKIVEDGTGTVYRFGNTLVLKKRMYDEGPEDNYVFSSVMNGRVQWFNMDIVKIANNADGIRLIVK